MPHTTLAVVLSPTSFHTLLVALFLAKVADPALIIAAIAAWFWGRSWPMIIAFCIVAAVVQELVVESLHPYWTFQPIMLALGFAAALVWAFAALGVRRLVVRGKPT